MKIDFVLCYEHAQRELAALLIVKDMLKKRGYKVRLLHVIPGDVDYWQYCVYEPRVVVFPWVYGERELSQAVSFKGKIPIVVNMQCEQLLSNRVLKSGFFSIKGQAKTAYHVSWGPVTTKRYKECGVDENHILEIGNINLEINDKKNDINFFSKEQLGKRYKIDVSKKWILFASNFKLPNKSMHELASMENRTGNIWGLTSEMIKSKKVILKWLIALMDECADIEIIYRPHPIEQNDSMLKYMACKYDRFHYIGDMILPQWVRVSECVLTWNSTAVIDAIFRGIPAAELLPYDLGKIYEGDVDHICFQVSDYEQLHNFLNNYDSVKDTNRNQMKQYIINQNDSIHKFVEMLLVLYKDGESVHFEKRKKNIY